MEISWATTAVKVATYVAGEVDSKSVLGPISMV